MKNLKSLLVVAFATISSAVMAQATYTASNGDKYEFKKNWFIGLQGGAQHTLGEAPFDKLISPNAQISLGHNFSPVVSARIAVNAWQSKGGFNGVQIANNVYGNETFKWNYFAPTVDVMFNLSNLICGWNPFRTVNVTALVGAGANIASSNSEAQDLAKKGYEMAHLWDGTLLRPVGRAGLAVDFRLSDAVSLGIEANANVTTDHYNSKHADNPDWYFNALAGLKINLGKSYTKVPAPEPIPEPIVEAPKPAPAPAPVVVKKDDPYRCEVFFKINKIVAEEVEVAKIEKLAAFLEKNADRKVAVCAYADKGTGNAKINQRLSEGRANYVADMLRTKYGIAAERITVDFKGDTEQPFAENDLNRVTICVTD